MLNLILKGKLGDNYIREVFGGHFETRQTVLCVLFFEWLEFKGLIVLKPVLCWGTVVNPLSANPIKWSHSNNSSAVCQRIV